MLTPKTIIAAIAAKTFKCIHVHARAFTHPQVRALQSHPDFGPLYTGAYEALAAFISIAIISLFPTQFLQTRRLSLGSLAACLLGTFAAAAAAAAAAEAIVKRYMARHRCCRWLHL